MTALNNKIMINKQQSMWMKNKLMTEQQHQQQQKQWQQQQQQHQIIRIGSLWLVI